MGRRPEGGVVRLEASTLTSEDRGRQVWGGDGSGSGIELARLALPLGEGGPGLDVLGHGHQHRAQEDALPGSRLGGEQAEVVLLALVASLRGGVVVVVTITRGRCPEGSE